MINPKVFKSYDIRGIYPEDLDESSATLIGKIIASKTGAKKIVVGRDARLSSESLFKALTEGILSSGVDVIDIGQVPTECLYYATGVYSDAQAGVMITASHNPKEYNGFKVISKNNNELRVINGYALKEASPKESSNRGNIEKRDNIVKEYVDHIFSIIDVSNNAKIVVDTGNGMAGKTIPLLDFSLEVINSKIDGNFPGRGPNPAKESASEPISKKIKEINADAGFMFDGDADRVFLVDENGAKVPADITELLIARNILNKYPGSAISYNLTSTRALKEFLIKWGARPIRSKVGFVYVQGDMIDNNGAMGGEVSGHYCFRDNFNMDSGLLAMLLILKEISGKKVSELVKELNVYYREPAMEFPVKDGLIDLLKENYKDGKQDELDGLTVEYESWWFNARPSNTEPILRITMEADNKEIYEEKKNELMEIIKRG